MKLAIVGTGISGLACAHRLHRSHEVTLFEGADRVGGHSNTVRVDLADETHHVDTGFIVYNEANYPRFTRLLAELGVETQPSEMSFSVRNERTDHEWSGSSLDGLFAHRGDLVRPRHWRMLADILRFNRAAHALLATTASTEPGPTLDEFLTEHRFRGAVVEDYVVPLGASIWSADPTTFGRYPSASLFRFLDNHGLLSLGGRPAWRTVTGGSAQYVDRLVAPFRDRIRLGQGVEKVVRDPDGGDGGVELVTADHEPERFDQVILACHADEALELLGDPTPAEHEILGAIRFQPNVATLHTGTAMLPRSPRAWSSWNYHVTVEERRRPTLTYWMNRLQSLDSAHEICVTLNRPDEINPSTVLGQFEYSHPVYDPGTLAAQARRHQIQGRRNTWFVGAWWGYGFHEDGVASSDEVAAALVDQHRRRP
ncbi:MAG: FAD-dependent oxidoreductase [Acidimicrobiales bacterium]|nr:FAD-dependent oxidoreductase [Acidimicrobiales bacterium]